MLGGLANVLLRMGVMKSDGQVASPYHTSQDLPRPDLLGDSLFHKHASEPEILKTLLESYNK